MKTFKQLVLLILTTSLLAACASSTPTALNEKYIFPELKQVDRVLSSRIDGWGEIDKQSLFVSTSPSRSYLIILKRPSNDIGFARNLSFSSSGSSLDAKFDRLYFYSSHDSIEPIPAYIDRIYEVNGKAQKKMIRAKINGEEISPSESGLNLKSDDQTEESTDEIE